MTMNRLKTCCTVVGSAVAVATSSILHAENKIGVILPMTGDFARYGKTVRQGLESTKLSPFKYVYEDEGCNPRAAVSAFHKLYSFDKAKVFVEPWCGSPQIAVASLLAQVDGLAILHRGECSPFSRLSKWSRPSTPRRRIALGLERWWLFFLKMILAERMKRHLGAHSKGKSSIL